MTNENLAKWIAGKLPAEHAYKDKPIAIEISMVCTDSKYESEAMVRYESEQVTVGLMLDALSEVGCEFQLEGADGEGYHLIKVMTEDSHHWDIIKHGKSRYLAVKTACEAVAEREDGQ